MSESSSVSQAGGPPQFVMGSGGSTVPDGSYYARLVAINPVPEKVVNGETWRPGWEFVFEITTGPYKGSRKPSTHRNAAPTERNGLGRTVAGLLGKMPQPGDQIDLGRCLGRTYLIVIQGGKITGISDPPQQ